LCFKKGDIITITQIDDEGWWEGTLHDKTGWFPSNYVKEYRIPGMSITSIYYVFTLIIIIIIKSNKLIHNPYILYVLIFNNNNGMV